MADLIFCGGVRGTTYQIHVRLLSSADSLSWQCINLLILFLVDILCKFLPPFPPSRMPASFEISIKLVVCLSVNSFQAGEIPDGPPCGAQHGIAKTAAWAAGCGAPRVVRRANRPPGGRAGRIRRPGQSLHAMGGLEPSHSSGCSQHFNHGLRIGPGSCRSRLIPCPYAYPQAITDARYVPMVA
jgi:hypothetical protein